MVESLLESLAPHREGLGVAVRRGEARLRHLVRNSRVESVTWLGPRDLLSLLDHPDCQVVEQVVALGGQL